MKWFLTEAQLSALRLDAHHEVLATYVARFDAELDRLRADRAQELQRAADPHGPFVAHLKDEVAFWRLQYIRERQRSEIAIDACRVQHQGVAAVSMDLRPQGEGGAMTGHAERDQFNDPELAGMGLTEGVG